MAKDYYSILQVSPRAEQAAIDAAYLRLAQKYHPSRHSGPDSFARLREVNEAWQVLSNRSKRAQYDRARKREQRRERVDTSLRARLAQHRATTDLLSNETIDSLTHPQQDHHSRKWLGMALLLFMIATSLGVALPQFNRGRYAESAISSAAALPAITATAEPSATPTSTMTASATEACPHGCAVSEVGCVIRAQAGSTDGQKLYYLPDDPDYDSIVLTLGSSDRWFCTEADALLDGWTHRKPTPTATPTFTPTATATATLAPRRLYASPAGPILLSPLNPTRTPLPAPAGFKYPPPRLTWPADGSSYKCNSALQLRWAMADPSVGLQNNEWFVVESIERDHGTLRPLNPTRDLWLNLTPVKNGKQCDAPWWVTLGAYQWHVRIVSGNFATLAIQSFLSDWSQSFVINYSD